VSGAQRPIGVAVTPMETRREVIVHLAQRAEALGYTSFSVAEGWGHDAFALLAEIAIRTTTLRIGANVVNVWGRSPATIAMSATTLAHQSSGRFFLGLGAGSPALAEGLHDLAFRDPVGRVESVTEQVRRLLDGQRLAPRVEGAQPLRLAVTAADRIPIAIAALGPRSVGLAGRLADYWTPFFLPVSGLAATGEPLAGGRPSRTLTWPGIPAAVSADPERARSLAAWWLMFYLTKMGPLYPATLVKLGFGREVDAVVAANPPGAPPTVPARADRLVSEIILGGSADDVRSQLESWYEAGADMPTIVLTPGVPVEELDCTLEGLAPIGNTRA
jgi:alkanesulfonate monooxygenase SsuD/methylene tetrahydromethanopterin reductase-like flavin-dependent oxidoreductase (luciferase family)